MASINTNYGALVALQNLNKTTAELDVVQNRVNTGLKVGSAKDNGAVYAIAQSQRSRVAAIASISDGIDRANNVIDTGLSAGETISDLLTQMKEKSVAAQAGDLSNEQRAALQSDFSELRAQVNRIANSATFNGANVVNGASVASALRVMMSDVGGSGGTVHGFQGAGSSTSGDIISRNATLTQASESAAAANDLVDTDDVRIRVGTSTDYWIDNTASKTVAQYVAEVNSVTGGAVRALFDDATGRITYLGRDDTTAFTVDAFANDRTTARASTFIEGSSSSGTTDTDTSATTTITAFDLRVGGTGALNAAGGWDIGTSAASASVVATALDAAINTVNSNLATLGSQSKALETQKAFMSKLSGAVEKGIGQLVDADLAKESARLQALQIKQQLGAQALSIANQSPSILLSFFR